MRVVVAFDMLLALARTPLPPKCTGKRSLTGGHQPSKALHMLEQLASGLPDAA